MRASFLPIAAVGLCIVPGCVIDPSNHDAGNVAFVHQAVQTLLCRKPRSTLEISVLASRVTTHGRDYVAQALMETPEFYDCWTQILMDHMQVQRSGEYAQLQTCVNEPTYIVEDPVPCTDGNPLTLCVPCSDSDPAGSCMAKATALTTHIRDDRPRDLLADLDGDGITDEWNMHDTIRAALLVDDLHVAWRPWLFALAGRPQINGGPTDNEVRDVFLSSAFDVKTECLGCHSTTYSKTEVYPTSANPWDRSASHGFDLHGDLLGSGATVNTALDPTGKYVSECAGCHGPTGTTWPSGRPKPHSERIPVMTRDGIITQILEGSSEDGVVIMAPRDLDGDGVIGFGDPQDLVTAAQLADFLLEQLGGHEDIKGFTNPDQFAAAATVDPAFAAAKGPFGMSEDACGFKWRHDSTFATPSVLLGAVGNRLHYVGGHSTEFPDVGAVAGALKDGLPLMSATGAGDTTDPVDPNVPDMVDQEASVAVLLAKNIANNLLEELTGNRGAVAHGLSRTPEQAELLRTMTALLHVEVGGVHRLSLKTALTFGLISELFNRRAPSDPVAPNPNNGYGAYQLEMYFNPWAATASGIPDAAGNNLNGQGDVVHRRSPDQLVWSLHHDLGWPAPTPAPDPASATFPTAEWMRQVGRFESSRSPGSPVWQLDSLVMYENEVGFCTNPGSGTDFIDELANDALAAAAIPTVKSISLGLKDRLLQEPFFTPGAYGLAGETEETLARNLFNAALGAGAFNSAAKPAKAGLLKLALRAYCGVLIMSPDYLMAAIPTVKTAASTAGVFTTCLPGEDCTQTELETRYDCYLGRVGAIVPAPVCPP